VNTESSSRWFYDLCDTVRIGNNYDSQETSRLRYREHYGPPFDPMLSQLNPLHSVILFGLIYDVDYVINLVSISLGPYLNTYVETEFCIELVP
jgi:hypothetical protein